MTPKEAVNAGLDIYRAEMRDVIQQTLQQEFGGDWCKNQVAPLFGGGKARKILRELDRGQKPETLIDVGEFSQVIAEHQLLFPEAIRTGEHHSHMSKIANRRNWAVHVLGPIRRTDAEQLLGWCIDVLNQCGRNGAARDIEDDVVSELRAAQSATLAQSSTPWWQRIPGWGWGVLAVMAIGVVAGIVLLIYFLALRDSPQQQIFDRIDCSPVEAATGETVHCSPVSGGLELPRSPDTFYWRGGGNPATGNGTEFETIFENPGRYVIQLNVRSGDEHEGHGIESTIAEQSTSQGVPRAETDSEPTVQASPQASSDEPTASRPAQETQQNAESQPDPQSPEDEPPASQPLQESQQGTGLTLGDDSQTIAGRIVMRIIGPSSSAEGTWRIEFGFMPEAILTAAETSSMAIEANQDLLPRLRFLSEAVLLARARANDQRWLSSSPIDIRLSASGLSDSATGRVIARWHPSGSGAFRVEFGVLPEWALTAAGGDLQAAATQALLPGHRFISDARISRDVERSPSPWRASDVVEMPIRDPRLPESGGQEPDLSMSVPSSFARCEGDPSRVFYFNSDVGTKHWLNVSADAATRILGASWWNTIGWLSAAECEQWPTGSPYDERDVQEIASAEGG